MGRRSNWAVPGGAFAVVLTLVVVGASVVAVRNWRDHGRLELIGDSLTTVSAGPLNDTLGHDHDAEIIAVPGARADQMVPIVADKVGGHPGIVIVNLGTNDVMSETPVDTSVKSVREILDRFPGACKRIVTVNEAMYSTRNPNLADDAQALNSALEKLAGETGAGLIQWDDTVRDYLAAGEPDGPLLSDTVRPTPLGQQRMADLYRDSIEPC